MSALRKLRQARLVAQQQRQQLQDNAESAEDTAAEGKGGGEAGDDDNTDRRKAAINAFDLLNEDDEEEEEEGKEQSPGGAEAGDVEEEEEDEGDEGSADGPHQANGDSPPTTTVLSPSADASRSSRGGTAKSHPKRGGHRGGGGKGATKGRLRSEKADGGGQASKGKAKRGEEDRDEDLEEVLRSLDSTNMGGNTGAGEHKQVDVSNDVDWAFLSTQQRHLDANTEIRARFGSAALMRGGGDGDEKAASFRSRQGGRRRGGQPNAATATSQRRQRLVKVVEDWPPMVDRGDLKMIRTHALTLNHSTSSLPTQHSRGLAAINSAGPSGPPSSWLLSSSSCPLFQFSYSGDYDRLQQEYLSCISTHDVQAVMFFSRAHPYHCDCCLQMAELCESQGDFLEAHRCVQRALHMFDLSMHRDFDIFSSRCRLDPHVIHNQTFFVALARHAHMLGKKGCHRTALELLKLLLSLSPLYDPQCSLQLLDFHAVKCQQFAFLLDFPRQLDEAVVHSLGHQQPWPALKRFTQQMQRQTGEAALTAMVVDEKRPFTTEGLPPSTSASLLPAPRPPTSLLPNFCFSRALAAFHLEVKDSRDHGTAALDPSITPPTLSFFHSANHHTNSSSSSTSSSTPRPLTSPLSTSSSLLHSAVLLYPEVVEPLLRHSGAEKEAEKAEWKAPLSRLSSIYPPSSYVDKLVLVYTERSGVLWKGEAFLSWLKEVCQHIVRTLDRSTQSLSSFHLLRASLFPRGGSVPLSLSSLQRSQFTDAVVRLPPELLLAQAQAVAEEEGRRRAMDGEGGHGIDGMSLAQLRQALEANGLQGLNVAADHPLMALLRSLLPWNVVAPQVQGRVEERNAGEEAEGQRPGVWGDAQQAILQEVDEPLDFLPDEDEGVEEEDLGEH